MKVNYKKTSILVALAIFFLISSAPKTLAQKKKNKSDKEGISKERTQEAEKYFMEGMKEYLLENYSKAVDNIEKSLSFYPDNAAAYYIIAQVNVKQNNLFKSISYAQKAIELDPSNKYYHLLLANIFERKQDFEDASKVLNNMLKVVPNSTEHYYDLAIIYLYLNKLDEAVKCFDKFEKAYGISEELIKQKQQIYLKNNKINEAISEGKKLINAFPDEPRFMIGLIELLVANNKNDEAEKFILEILKKDPYNGYANIYLHEIYLSKNQPQKAFDALRLAFKSQELEIDIKIGVLVGKIRQLPNEEIKQQCLILSSDLVIAHPSESKAYAMNADVLVLSGKNEEALSYYLKSVKLDNTHFKIWQQIVILDQELNLNDSLKKHSEKALELFPNQAVFWFYNGIAHQIDKNYKKSVASFEEGRKLSINDKPLLLQFYTLLGDSYNGLKEYKKSDECFEEALKFDDNNFLVLNNYSYYLSLRKDKLDYARKMSEKVVKENPENATYLDTYAWILYVMKDYEKAKEIFERIANKTNNGTIIEHYGDVLYQLGQKDMAVEQWKKAKGMGEASELIDKKISDKKLYE